MSNIYIISKSLHDEFSYQKVYRTAHTEPLIFEKYGTFNSDRFDNVGRTELRQNLYGYRLRSKTILAHNDSINVYQSYANKVVDTFPKAHLLMAMDLMAMLNATVRMVVVPGFGLFNQAAGTSYGIPLDIIIGQLDFSATGYLYRADRVAYFEYVIAPVQTYAACYYRTPSLSYTDNLFVLPFDELVWACFLVLIALMVALLTGIMFCEWNVPLVTADEGAQADEQSDLLRVSIYDSFVLIFGATCQQGSAVTPRCNSARLFMIVSFIALMFLFTSYSANIVALLQSPSDKIRTLQDMLDSPLEMGVDTSPYVETYFPVRARARWTKDDDWKTLLTSHFPLQFQTGVKKTLYETKIKRPDGKRYAPAEGVKKMREEFFAIHLEHGVAMQLVSDTFFEHEKCSIRKVLYVDELAPTIIMPKNSSYYEMFKIGWATICKCVCLG